MADDPTRLSFAEAIAYFAKKLSIPSKDAKAIQGNENDWAFTIAGVTNAEMLADFKSAVQRYLEQGLAFGQFQKDFASVAERYGWKPKEGVAWRASVTVSTNMRMAYSAGQHQQRQNPAIKKLRPGLMWLHRDSPQFRPHHKAMDRKVFDSEKYPNLSAPSGYGCRCRLVSVPRPEDGYYDLSDSLPYVLPNGKKTEIPAIPVSGKLYPIADPGFYYAPGQSPISERPAILQQMIQRQPPALQKLIRRAIPQRILQKFLPRGFGNG